MSEDAAATGVTYFSYLNGRKVDSLFSQLQGRLETERTEEVSKGLDGKVSTSAELGGILSFLGIGKLSAGAEATKSSGKVLSVTSTLTPENKVLVLMEYLWRAGQLVILQVDDLDEQGVLDRIKGHPFQVLLGRFTTQDEEVDGRVQWSSETQTARGTPLVEVPTLPANVLLDQMGGPSEGEYWPNSVLAQVFVRPGRLVASPVAMWWPVVDPDDNELTYWGPHTPAAGAEAAPGELVVPDPEDGSG